MPTPSVEPAVRSRLLPRFSFRTGMIVVSSSVLIAWLGRLAWQGYAFPQAICFALLSLAAFYIASVFFFWVAWLPAVLVRRMRDPADTGNPFADDQLPPQILPPKGVSP